MRAVPCRGCGEPIIFIRMKAGKNMPCDPELVPFWWEPGGEIFITEEGEMVTGSRDGEPYEMTGLGYIPHWATCTKAEMFRKKSPEKGG